MYSSFCTCFRYVLTTSGDTNFYFRSTSSHTSYLKCQATCSSRKSALVGPSSKPECPWVLTDQFSYDIAIYLAGLMFGWGIVNMCMGFVKTFGQLVALRFLLGILEAGVVPGIIYLTSTYYRRHDFQLRTSFFFCSVVVAGAFGGVSIITNSFSLSPTPPVL